MLKNLREYINSEEFKITILKEKINIINYDLIRDISEKEILLSKDNKRVKIIGKNLKLNKLLDSEILIIGQIERVEFYE